MSFFYRVFTTVEKNIWASEIEEFLINEKVGLNLCAVVDEEDADNLDATPIQLLLYDASDREIASLEYERVDNSDILPEEIEEFHGFVDGMLPECNREWVHNKLKSTIGCYCFSVLKPGFELANWECLAILAEWLRKETLGIEQSDGGQITNEEGEVVLLVPDDVDDDYEDDDFDEEEFDDSELEDDEEDGVENDVEDLEIDGLEDEFNDDDIDFADECEIEEFSAAIRVNDKWEVLEVNSEETLDQFLRGEV